jgi:hypothetical protein
LNLILGAGGNGGTGGEAFLFGDGGNGGNGGHFPTILLGLIPTGNPGFGGPHEGFGVNGNLGLF